MSSKASLAPQEPNKQLPSASALFGDTFSLFSRHATLFFGYAGWMLVPLIGLVFIRITLGSTQLAEQLIWILQALSLVLHTWVYASICQLTFSLKTHDQIITTPISLLRPFIILMIFSLLVFTGLSLFIIPGLIFLTWFTYAPIIAVLERGGLITSFIASKAMTKGAFWQTFRRLCALFIPLFFLYTLTAVVFALVYPELLTLDATTPVPLPVDITLSLAEILFTPIIVIYLTLLYLARKNG